MNTLSRSTHALTDALRRQIGPNAFLETHEDYVGELESNLVPGVERWMFVAELDQAGGSELKAKGGQPPKFHAAYSSAALAVNAFGPWKNAPESLELAGIGGFGQIEFEAPCHHGLESRAPPTLDVLATRNDGIVAVESKCTETLRLKAAKFSLQYESLVDTLFEPQWLQVYQGLKANPKLYQHLDAAQLVKHYLGLRNTFPDRHVVLLYLFWEPTNATKVSEFQRHREEVSEFAELVSGSAIRFTSSSYLELWTGWKNREHPNWLSEHVAQLKARYELAI